MLSGALILGCVAMSHMGPALPSELQLDWHEHEKGAMITWNMFANCVPNDDPDASERTCACCNGKFQSSHKVVKAEAMQRYYPSKYNVTQQVEVAASFGASYIIFAVQQMVGFALWDTKVNNFSIAHTPFRGGGYDIMAEYVAACKHFNIKPGVFYTTEQNNYNTFPPGEGSIGGPAFTLEQQDEFCAQQLEELLGGTYGEPFELWLDGGADIRMNKTWAWLASKNNFIIHGHANRSNSVSWVGNEMGFGPLPVWHSANASSGVHSMDGSVWFPTCADLVLREHCWSWVNNTGHPTDTKTLVEKYWASTGHGSKFMLNLAPMTYGDMNETDIAAYKMLGDAFKCLEKKMLSNVSFTTAMTPVGATPGQFQMQWPVVGLTTQVTIRLREMISKGQFIDVWALSTSIDGGGTWAPLDIKQNQSVGYLRILPNVTLPGAVTHLKIESNSTWGASYVPALRDVVVFDATDSDACFAN